jgi:small GTP-binding protein
MAEGLDSKIVLLGSASVGKTSIILRAVSDEFDTEMPATIGACYTAKQVDVGGTSVNLQIWDTAGQERFRTLAPMYYRGSIVALLTFSVIEDKSLQDVKDWADEIKQQADEMPVLFVVANKADLADERTVTTDQGEAVSKELGAFYAEVSAKTGRGIDELFVRVAEESVKKLKNEGGGGGGGAGPEKSVVLKADAPGKPKKGGCC